MRKIRERTPAPKKLKIPKENRPKIPRESGASCSSCDCDDEFLRLLDGE